MGRPALTEPQTPDTERRPPHTEPPMPDMGRSALEGERWLGGARTLVAQLRADRFLSRAGERRASARMDRSARLTETACRYSTISMGAARLLRNITEREL